MPRISDKPPPFAGAAARVACNHARNEFKAALGKDDWRSDMDLRRSFNAVKRERYPWISELSANASKNAIIHLGNACKRWNADRKARKSGKKTGGDRVGFPKPRSIKRGGYRCQADNGAGTVKTGGERRRTARPCRIRDFQDFDSPIPRFSS